MRLRIPFNYVLVQIQGQFYEKVKSLYIDTSFNPEQHHVIMGVVKSVPEKIFFPKQRIDQIKNEFGGSQNCPLHRLEEIQELTRRSAQYDVDMELKERDTIFYHYNVYGEAHEQGRVFTKDRETFILIPYDMVFVAIRDEEVIPVNGLVLIEPEQVQVGEFDLPRESDQVGKIAHIGSPVRNYIGYPDESDEEFYEFGDRVVFRKTRGVPLEFGIHQRLDKKYFKMHRKDIVCKI